MTRLNIPLFVALAASLLSAINARDQLPHQRMIRKRGPAPVGYVEAHAPAFVVPRWPGLVDRQAADPSQTASGSVSATRSVASSSASASATSSASSSAQATSSAVTSSSASASAESSLSASSSSQGGLLDSLTAVLGGTQSSTSSVASSTSSSSLSSSSSSVASSSSAAPQSASSVVQATSQTPVAAATPTLNLATASPTSANPTQSVAVVFSTATVPEAEQSQAAAKAKTAKITRNTIISLVVVASCIGGAIAIWTVIRKWKLSPSERFDDRMQPIDWAPTGGATGVRDDPLDEKTHRRAGSTGSHGSFTSGGVGQSELGHAGAKSIYSDATGHGNANAQYGAQAQDFPPPHDFTAGASHAAYGQYQGQQYAGAGYADLRRGPSVTESNYSHGAGTYSRGPAYEAQPGAAGVPPLPNPYGGYENEEYAYQPQGQTQGQGQYRGY